MTSDRPAQSRLGRRIVLIAYCLIFGPIGLTIAGSIIADLYGKPPPASSANTQAREQRWCARTIVGLKEDMEHELTLALEPTLRRDEQAQRWNNWHTNAGEQLHVVFDKCSRLGEGTFNQDLQALRELHQNYGEVITRLHQARREAVDFGRRLKAPY